jgi:hypothetical protein
VWVLVAEFVVGSVAVDVAVMVLVAVEVTLLVM